MDSLQEFLGDDFYNGLMETPQAGSPEASLNIDDLRIEPGPPSFSLGQAAFTVYSNDKVAIKSPKAGSAVWTVQELLVVFAFILSPLCKSTMNDISSLRKKGIGSHPRSSYTQVLCGTLYVKWIRLSDRWFLQVDRYMASDVDGFPCHRVRFNKTVLWQLERSDMMCLLCKLGDSSKQFLPPSFFVSVLDKAAEHLLKSTGSTFEKKRASLRASKGGLTSDFLLLLGEYCTQYDIGCAPAIMDIINDDRLEVWCTLAQATG
jgi:hypothetical protein